MVGHHENDTIDSIESSLDSPIAKCLLYNLDILKDKYIKDKIRQIAQKKIDQAKFGIIKKNLLRMCPMIFVLLCLHLSFFPL